ncbi:MAG TPA: hypothetical protein VFF08_05925 [Trueperaceae bacterium]|nr:hypothetical protein [Trueperaceae bacterium]
MADARPLRQRLLGVLIAPALVLGLAACDTNRGGFSAEDAAAIRDQIEQVADRLDAVEQRLMDLSAEGEAGEPAQLISEVREVRDDVGEARNMLTEVSQQLADEQAEEAVEPGIDDPLAPPANDPLAPPANDPLAPPANDPLAPDGGLGAPDIGDDVNQLGEDAQQGLDDLQEGADDALDDLNDPTPLDDPLVPNAPDL